jgi:hypothetical protein
MASAMELLLGQEAALQETVDSRGSKKKCCVHIKALQA